MYKYFTNAVDLAKLIMTEKVSKGSIVLDCTLGNGNDTLHLANLVGENGKVYGFDIQAVALDITREKLEKENLLNRTVLIKDSHEKIDKYIKEELDLIVYNLGYLPGGDKNIRTNPESTLMSLEKSVKLLKKNGLLLVTSYTGHSGGLEEKEKVRDFLQKLNQKYVNVLEFNFINQKNNPPVLYGVEKI